MKTRRTFKGIADRVVNEPPRDRKALVGKCTRAGVGYTVGNTLSTLWHTTNSYEVRLRREIRNANTTDSIASIAQITERVLENYGIKLTSPAPVASGATQPFAAGDGQDANHNAPRFPTFFRHPKTKSLRTERYFWEVIWRALASQYPVSEPPSPVPQRQ
jgi:hypothetical protein